jgi:hypothetical protein
MKKSNISSVVVLFALLFITCNSTSQLKTDYSRPVPQKVPAAPVTSTPAPPTPKPTPSTSTPTPAVSTPAPISSAPRPSSPYYTGDGGEGKSVAILAPKAVGLDSDQNYLPSLVQGELVSNFSGYSAMSVLDRQRLDEQYAELLSGYYDEDAEAGLDLGHLPPTDYILSGTITKTSTGYNLQIAITKTADKITAASYSGTCSFPELDDLSGVRKASLDLLQKMGVEPTARTQTELAGAAAKNHISGQTALAQGITAQQQGTVVEALSYYIQSTTADPSLAEAASRLNILSTDISSGNIGANVRNDLEWRDQWVARLKECEEFVANYLKDPPPYYLVYSTSIRQGAIDYDNRVVRLISEIGSYPQLSYISTLNRVIGTVKAGLEKTGRARTWGLESSYGSILPWKSVSSLNPFTSSIDGYWVEAEIINEENTSIGKSTVFLPGGWDRSRYGYYRSGEFHNLETMFREPCGCIELIFNNVDPYLITDKLTLRISLIDNQPVETTAVQRRINIIAEDDFEKTEDSKYFQTRNSFSDNIDKRGIPRLGYTVSDNQELLCLRSELFWNRNEAEWRLLSLGGQPVHYELTLHAYYIANTSAPYINFYDSFSFMYVSDTVSQIELIVHEGSVGSTRDRKVVGPGIYKYNQISKFTQIF